MSPESNRNNNIPTHPMDMLLKQLVKIIFLKNFDFLKILIFWKLEASSGTWGWGGPWGGEVIQDTNVPRNETSSQTQPTSWPCRKRLVKKVYIFKWTQSKLVSFVFDSVLGTLRLSRQTLLRPCTYDVLKATNEARLKSFDGRSVSSKRPPREAQTSC